tara:strand:+ start:25533 stop:26207 length:675 start_codon:yes stop_codon:yes gene_type:complete
MSDNSDFPCGHIELARHKSFEIDDSSLLDDQSTEPQFEAIGRWKTFETYSMRRIFPIKDQAGRTIGFRPMIQQGKGSNRRTISTVFRVNDLVDKAMAMAMAMDWRDKKEAELGMLPGRVRSKSADRFVPGISLVVSKVEPYRACWKWSKEGHKALKSYISIKRGYLDSYVDLVSRICVVLEIEQPHIKSAPMCTAKQYLRLQRMGIEGLPDRRRADRACPTSAK